MSSNRGKWQCKDCKSTDPVTDMHRVVREILEKLVFMCPKCLTVKRTYNEVLKHINECKGPSEPGVDPVVDSIKQITP